MVNGQGLLAFSMKGINRVCVVVIVYLMRKYLWTFNRCLEYLKSRKSDIAISNCIFNQLLDYESKLIHKEWNYQVHGKRKIKEIKKKLL